MDHATFRTQYRKFRILISKFFSYWFFVLFATVGTAFAVLERFTHVFHVENLEPFLILILVYALLVYVVTERAKVLDDIHDSIKSSKAVVHPTRESVYTKIPLILAKASVRGKGRRRIFHAALHGNSGRRIARPVQPDPLFELFDSEIDKCVASAGTGMWNVFEIYNIADEDRLDGVQELLEKRKDAEGYEVRAFSLNDGLPHLSPLIIGEEDLLLGVDDPRYYRMRAATHLQGRDHVRLATEYFYSLWNDPRIRVLKTETSVEWKEIEALRAKLRAVGGLREQAG
ncbi:MAG: hypothetical protein C3F14_04345 [Deltaproteobacteria bacterium]|nr:MAG: hypothetical protein C3F14_04345 [Deltaproteobacteria bacterium]